MKSTYKLVAIDIDGTLLDSQHSLSPRNREAITRLSRQGVHITLATGKPYFSIGGVISDLGLQSPCIANGGAIIANPAMGEVLLQETLPSRLAMQVMDTLTGSSATLLLASRDAVYTEHENDDTVYMESFGNPAPILIPRLGEIFESSLTHLVVIAYNKNDVYEKVFLVLQKKFGRSLSITRSSPYFIEIHKAGVSKGSALALLTRSLGLTRRDVMCLGDSPNDLSMFDVSGYSVAMGNAVDAVKKRADIVTETNDNAGVAVCLEKIFQVRSMSRSSSTAR